MWRQTRLACPIHMPINYCTQNISSHISISVSCQITREASDILHYINLLNVIMISDVDCQLFYDLDSFSMMKHLCTDLLLGGGQTDLMSLRETSA